jgi:hypothetical protein
MQYTDYQIQISSNLLPLIFFNHRFEEFLHPLYILAYYFHQTLFKSLIKDVTQKIGLEVWHV